MRTMNFAFTDEQEELRKTVRAFMESKSAEAAVRELMETEEGYDAAVWKQAAEQLGLQGLAIPEEFGGSGYGFVELGIVLEEMGRALFTAPFFSTVVLAGTTLLQSGDEAAKQAHLPGIASGETIATLAVTEPNGKWDESGIEATATKSGDTYTINGTKSFVIDGHLANLIIVAAKTDGGTSLFAVEGDASGLTRTSLSTMDQTRKQAKLELKDVPGTLIGAEGDGTAVLDKAFDLIVVGLAAEQVGGAQKVLEMAVEYAKVRVQFGRPIGSFQAIKHKCADMLLEVESAKSAAYYGLWCASEDNDELPSVASLAKAYCSEAYFHAAAENIQIHGGIGFTWEHPAHLYFKRAKSSELLFGDPTYHREKLAQRIGI
jgi:alkylation response protein AidB-like acyl-CoA dehydrogenase